MSMEEARYRALFLAMFMLMLTIGGKCSYLRAKLAHLAGHLPPRPRFSSINCMRRAREQCAWLLPIRHPSPAHTILFIIRSSVLCEPDSPSSTKSSLINHLLISLGCWTSHNPAKLLRMDQPCPPSKERHMINAPSINSRLPERKSRDSRQRIKSQPFWPRSDYAK